MGTANSTPGSPVYPVRAMKSNASHTTFIVEEPDGDSLYFTHHRMSGAAPGAQRYMRLMAHVPLLAHPDPRTALVICFGVGNTTSAVARHDTIERIDVVDLNDKVFETAPEFAATNQSVIDDPRLTLVHDDGRNFLQRTDRRYDLVTSEPPPPRNEGVYRLYSREYYQSVREHLTPRGMMTQWVPVTQMSPTVISLIVGTFLDVFPHSFMYVGYKNELVLVGGTAPIDLANLSQRFHDLPAVQRDLEAVEVRSPIQILARIIQGDATLRANYGGGQIISDQRNDLARHVMPHPDPPAVVMYDPTAVLADIDAHRLPESSVLARTVTNLSLLTSAVPDFPISSLMSVRSTRARGIAHADADWLRLAKLHSFATIAHMEGRTSDAIELLNACLEIVPDHAPVVARLQWVLADDQATREQTHAQAKPSDE